MLAIISNRVYFNKAILFALSYILTVSSALAATANDITDGVAAYNKGWYSIALHYLTLAEPQYPNNALLHYYRANTLVHLTKMPEAMEEYTQAAELDPNGVTGNYARQALQAAGLQPVTAPSVFTASSAATQQALLTQANALSTHLLRHGQKRSTESLQYGQERSDEIRQHEEAGAANMGSAGNWIDDGAGGSTWMPAFSADDIAAYRERKEEQAQNTLTMSQRAASTISSRATQRAAATTESANSLAQQLANPESRGITLSPVGTNLYVRNYILTPNIESATDNQTTTSPLTSEMAAKTNKLTPNQ